MAEINYGKKIKQFFQGLINPSYPFTNDVPLDYKPILENPDYVEFRKDFFKYLDMFKDEEFKLIAYRAGTIDVNTSKVSLTDDTVLKYKGLNFYPNPVYTESNKSKIVYRQEYKNFCIYDYSISLVGKTTNQEIFNNLVYQCGTRKAIDKPIEEVPISIGSPKFTIFSGTKYGNFKEYTLDELRKEFKDYAIWCPRCNNTGSYPRTINNSSAFFNSLTPFKLYLSSQDNNERFWAETNQQILSIIASNEDYTVELPIAYKQQADLAHSVNISKYNRYNQFCLAPDMTNIFMPGWNNTEKISKDYIYSTLKVNELSKVEQKNAGWPYDTTKMIRGLGTPSVFNPIKTLYNQKSRTDYDVILTGYMDYKIKEGPNTNQVYVYLIKKDFFKNLFNDFGTTRYTRDIEEAKGKQDWPEPVPPIEPGGQVDPPDPTPGGPGTTDKPGGSYEEVGDKLVPPVVPNIKPVPTGQLQNPGWYGGTYIPTYRFIRSIQNDVDLEKATNEMNDFLSTLEDKGKSDSLVECFIHYAAFINNTGSKKYHLPVNEVKFTVPNYLCGDTPETKYIPYNNKLFSYPYFSIEINGYGNQNELKLENFSTKQPSVGICSKFLPGAGVTVIPLWYGGVRVNYDASVVGQPLPVFAYTKNEYLNEYNACSNVRSAATAALIQNGVLQGISGAVTASIGTSTAVASKGQGGLGQIVKGSTNAVQGALSIHQGLRNFESQLQDAEARPPVVMNQNASPGLPTVINNAACPFIVWKSIRREFAEKVDEYFTRYGYKVDEFKDVDINSRKIFNFLKCKEARVEGNIPNEYLMAIKNILQKGITFWHDPSKIGDYSTAVEKANQEGVIKNNPLFVPITDKQA